MLAVPNALHWVPTGTNENKRCMHVHVCVCVCLRMKRGFRCKVQVCSCSGGPVWRAFGGQGKRDRAGRHCLPLQSQSKGEDKGGNGGVALPHMPT